jgi:lipopolysaccharide/colanic/teichoic acid biosynthesis glycosyltransferase
MNKPNYGRELKESLSHFILWAVNILIEGLILILWIFTQWGVNQIINTLKLNDSESILLMIFRYIFAISLLAQILIMTYYNIRMLFIRSHDIVKKELYKIEDKEQIKTKLTKTFQIFLPRFGAFIVSIFAGVAILLLFILFSNDNPFEYNYILFYLILPEFLVLYCIFTTKTSNHSLSLILFLLFIVLISIAIKLDSRGPVIFYSKRIGQFGVPFDCYKFRTIYTDNKISWLGKFLRRTLLDELPTYYNVLVSEMSLIGPRPRSPIMLENTIDAENKILSVKPGITGLSQLSASLIFNTQDAILLDLDYINKWSLFLDIKIFLKTIPTILFTKGQ